MKHSMRLMEKPFSQIKQGTKTIELRLYDEKRQKLSVGDIISFTNTAEPGEIINVRVIDLHVFWSFDELYDALPPEKFGYYGNPEKADARDMEEYYSKEEQQLYGALGIEFEVI